ncbi:MAG TPA: STAS domain-containing protein [Candidatus Ozemobacteraceae bacterium]|nr:STAS domain-containing protein [Candidatus Ozemobacteraceae bacterium]
MFFQVSTNNGRQVITADGDVAGEITGELTAAIKEQIEAGHKIIILDFAKASIIDSMGISAIVANIALLKRKSGQLILAACRPTVKKVFQLVGFEQHFPIVATVEEALKMQF